MPGPGSQPAYSIVDLGTLGGDTFASAINSQGEVVGYSNLSNGNFRAFLYEKGVMHDIGFLGTNKNDQSYAYAINASGVVVGESLLSTVSFTIRFFMRTVICMIWAPIPALEVMMVALSPSTTTDRSTQWSRTVVRTDADWVAAAAVKPSN